jgi:hypothetical protein
MIIAERTPAERLSLIGVGLACALASSVGFWLHMLGLVRMPFFVPIVGVPSIILMLILGYYSWQRQLSFWLRFRAGVVGGIAGLAAYDSVRFAIYSLHLFDYYPFATHRVFGTLITGLPVTSETAEIVGWAYHYWNGFSFALMYALIAGPARWYWGLVWAMILETATLFTYPSFLDVKMSAPFIVVSLIGHSCFGTALGLTVSRMMRGAEKP